MNFDPWETELNEIHPPRRLSGLTKDITLTHCLIPWIVATDQPCLVTVAGREGLSLPVFTTQKKLETFSQEFNVPYDKIKHIDDGIEFLDSIPKEIAVILDPRKHGNKTRHTEILRE